MTLYALGDIHGHLDKLQSAHDLVEADRAREGAGDAPLIHVGDLVDRGPDSDKVIRTLADLTASDPRAIVLKGNHDAMFVEFMTKRPSRWGEVRYLHPNIGGKATLASYGVEEHGTARTLHDKAIKVVPEEDIAFMTDLPTSFTAGECLFVHAGIRPGIPLDEQDPTDLIWIRDTFLFDTRDHGPLVVHGHTPVPGVEHHGNRLAIDTGAGWDGPVSAVAIEGRDAWLLTPSGRQPVTRLD